jgi:hypothetical protein
MVIGIVVALVFLAVTAASTVYSATKIHGMASALDRNTAAIERNTVQAAVARDHAKSAAAAAARADAAAREVGGWVHEIRDAAITLAKRKTISSSINAAGGAPGAGEGPASAP